MRLAPKKIQLIKELVPNAAVIGFLMNPSNPSAKLVTEDLRGAGSQNGVRLEAVDATRDETLDEGFAHFASVKVGGVVVYGDPFFDSRREKIVGLAARYGIPTMYAWREYAVAGGLMSYGSSLPDSYRRAAIYVGRILKGEKPADLPVQQPAKFELIINLKTAKALGLTVPQALLARADEVIE